VILMTRELDLVMVRTNRLEYKIDLTFQETDGVIQIKNREEVIVWRMRDHLGKMKLFRVSKDGKAVCEREINLPKGLFVCGYDRGRFIGYYRHPIRISVFKIGEKGKLIEKKRKMNAKAIEMRDRIIVSVNRKYIEVLDSEDLSTLWKVKLAHSEYSTILYVDGFGFVCRVERSDEDQGGTFVLKCSVTGQLNNSNSTSSTLRKSALKRKNKSCTIQ